jgi:glycine/D-amino acid oxidase-like deaminating enzyme/nitrite reductase/ring-hydroxylating ferredoxin subunit
MTSLSGKPGSCWRARANPTDSPRLDSSLHAETVVIGAGIVGLTAALRLCEAGRQVIVLEGLRIGEQVTGRSTAKITTQHALIYRELSERLGSTKARFYAEANSAGAAQIRDWVRLHEIDCDLETKAAYAYATRAERKADIEAEADAARKLGLRAEVLERAPLPFATAATLCFSDQAQFNPAAYLAGLATTVVKLGGRIYENSRAVFIGEASRWRAVTKDGNVHAENILVATNIPVKSPLGMATRTQPRSHVAMAFRSDDAMLIDGMFIGIDAPTRSLRMGRDAEGPLLVALGPKYNTGSDGNVAARFAELESWVHRNLPIGQAAWRWCNEDYDTFDHVPMAGLPDPRKSPGYFIATGFNGWGITNGTAAGMMIADLIIKGESPWQELYDPSRPVPKDFHKDGDSQSIVRSEADIRPGEGGVIVKDGEKVAMFRDETGGYHRLSAKCTHKGCTVTWNNADRTWDCPCHGSMFAADGSVLHGPARLPLEKKS